MPIRAYLSEEAFEPELVEAMGEAFAMLCDFLELAPAKDDAITRRAAVAVIAAAKSGAADIEGLFEAALKTIQTN